MAKSMNVTGIAIPKGTAAVAPNLRMAGATTEQSWPRWQVALAVGTPVVVCAAAGVLYYRWSRRNAKAKRGGESGQDGKKNKSLNNASSDVPTTTLADQQNVEEQDPLQRSQSIKNTGNKYFKAGKFDKAIKCYTEAIELCPATNKDEISTFYQNRAAAYEQLKNNDMVISDCTKALELNDRYVKALFRRAKAAELKNDLTKSLEDITAVCLLESFSNPQSMAMADRVLKDLGRSQAKERFKHHQPQNPSTQFIRNYFLSFVNDPIMNGVSSGGGLHNKSSEQTAFDNDEKEVSEEMEKHSKSPFERAVQLLHKHEYNDVMKLCTAEIDLDVASNHLADALLLRATFYSLRGEIELAMDDFRRLLDMNNISTRMRSNAMIKHACQLMQIAEIEPSLEEFEAAEKLDPDNSDIYHHRGQIHLLLGQFVKAHEDFEKSVSLCPSTFAISHVQKCYADIRMAMSEGNQTAVEEAIAKFEKTVKSFPECAEGYGLFGQVLGDIRRYTEADEYFRQAQKIEPDSGNIYVHRGLLRLQWKQDIDEAAKLITKAIEVEEKCMFAYETLATIEVQRGNLDRAVELFNKAINLVRTEEEVAHLYIMLESAITQARVTQRLGLSLPPFMG